MHLGSASVSPLHPRRQQVLNRGPVPSWAGGATRKMGILGHDLPPCAGFGLPALDAAGVPLPLLPTTLIFFRGPAPSDISPAVASPSLPDPAPPILGRRAAFVCGRGVPARLPGAVLTVFFIFFRDDSLPLDSDSAGDPARFRDLLFFTTSPCFCFPCGVVAPLEPAAFGLSLASAWPSLPSLPSGSFLSSSLLSSSSSSLESSSDYESVSFVINRQCRIGFVHILSYSKAFPRNRRFRISPRGLS